MADIQGTEGSQDDIPRSPRKAVVDMEDPEVRYQAAMTDLRCLWTCTKLLQNVNGVSDLRMLEIYTAELIRGGAFQTFQENSAFQGIIEDLVLPAVKNKEEPALRENGMLCLGMCCMVDVVSSCRLCLRSWLTNVSHVKQQLASQSLRLFIDQVDKADDNLRVKVAQIVFDLLMVHDVEKLLGDRRRLLPLLSHMLSQDLPAVEAVACEGVAKLMLSGMVYEDIVSLFIYLYISSAPFFRKLMSGIHSYSKS